VALEQERRVKRPGERIGGAVTKIEPRLRVNAFAERAVGLQCRHCLLAIKWYDLCAKLVEQGSQLIEPRLSRPGENHDADFVEGESRQKNVRCARQNFEEADPFPLKAQDGNQR
jgi:hypothetical protein